MKSLIIISLLAYGIHASGQHAGSFGFTTAQINTHQYFEQYGITEAKLHTIKGSPYDKPSFSRGNIYNSSGVVGSNLMLRYNIFADEIEIKDANTDSYSSLIKSLDFFAKIGNDLYIYVAGDNGGYFKVLTEGKNYDLYKKSKVKYIESVPAKDSYSREQPARFTREDFYFIVTKGGTFYELPNNRKKFVGIFINSHQKEIDQYIKKSKINLKAEPDMIKVMNYIDSLISE